MCCNNSNQKTLNEVISQMTALTNAVDKLRSEVNTIKVKSHLIQNERIDNESVRRAIIVRKCENKNCIGFRKLRQCKSIGKTVKGDCCVNVDRRPNEKVHLHPPPTPRSRVTDFGLDSSPNTKYSKKSSCGCSLSEESLSTISSSVLKSESIKDSKLKSVRSPQTADRGVAGPAAFSRLIGNESNSNERIRETIKMNNENEKWQNKELDDVSERSGSSETIESNFSVRNTPIVEHMQVKSNRTKIRAQKSVANKKNPKSKAGKSDSRRTGAVHNTNKFEATVQEEKNRPIKAKMSKGKLMQDVRPKKSHNDTVGLEHASEDGGDKSGELSDNSLNSNVNENTANKNNPKPKAGKSDSRRTGALHNTNKFEATVQEVKNQPIEAKMSKSKLMQDVRHKKSQNDSVRLEHASEDGGDKSGELSDNSLNSNGNKNTPTCICCSLLCCRPKKTVSQKLNTKNQNRKQTQDSSEILARKEAEGVVQGPIEPANKIRSKSEMATKNKQRVNVQSPSNTNKPSDIRDGKLTGPADKRGSGNQGVGKSQSSSTVDMESDSYAEKPTRNVNERVRRKRKKLKTERTVQSPSSSVNTLGSQSNSSAENIATTGNNKRKKRRKKVSQLVPVEIQSSNASSLDTESYSNFIEYNGAKIVNESEANDKGTMAISRKTTDKEVEVSQKVPGIITDKRTQSHEKHVNTTKRIALSERPRREIPKTVKLSDAAVGTTEEIPKSKSHAEDTSSGSSLSFENSLETTLDTSSEEHFANTATDSIRRWTTEEQLYGKFPEVWCTDKELISPICHCRRNTSGQYKVWLLIPFKHKNRSKTCDSCAPCERCNSRRISQDVKSSPRSNDFQDHAKPTSQEFTPSGYPTLHQNTFENYRVCSSSPSATTERPYLFSSPTFPRNPCSNMKPDQSKGGPHPYHRHLILNNLQKFDPGSRMSFGENHDTSQCNSLARMETNGRLTPENARINLLGSQASHVNSEEHRYPVCNDPNFFVPSYPSNYSLQNPPIREFRRFGATEPQIESRKPALFQRVANYFFSRKSSEYAYDPSMQFAGYQTCAELPGDYNIYSPSPPCLQPPQPYGHKVLDPLSQYEVLTETQRISHHFDPPQSAYTIMPVPLPQPQTLWRKFQVADASNKM